MKKNSNNVKILNKNGYNKILEKKYNVKIN